MNRYAALGITLDAHEGKRIVVLVARAAAIRHAMDEVMRVLVDADPDDYQVRRAAGDERIQFISGGSIRFLSVGATTHGWTADVVFLDEDVDRMLNQDDWMNLRAVTQPAGEIIRA